MERYRQRGCSNGETGWHARRVNSRGQQGANRRGRAQRDVTRSKLTAARVVMTDVVMAEQCARRDVTDVGAWKQLTGTVTRCLWSKPYRLDHRQ